MASHDNAKVFDGSEEKGISISNGAEVVQHDQPRYQEDFMTRNGLNLKSFQRRPLNEGFVVLDQSMKPRHLHMIAIGGSIGAGFFVGSGSALSKGVSKISAMLASTSLTYPGSWVPSHRLHAYGSHDLQCR